MKPVYTYEMFVEDSVVFDRQYEDTKHMLVPKDEWPVAKFSDLTFPFFQRPLTMPMMKATIRQPSADCHHQREVRFETLKVRLVSAYVRRHIDYRAS